VPALTRQIVEDPVRRAARDLTVVAMLNDILTGRATTAAAEDGDGPYRSRAGRHVPVCPSCAQLVPVTRAASGYWCVACADDARHVACAAAAGRRGARRAARHLARRASDASTFGTIAVFAFAAVIAFLVLHAMIGAAIISANH
jgi:hypothetical protein